MFQNIPFLPCFPDKRDKKKRDYFSQGVGRGKQPISEVNYERCEENIILSLQMAEVRKGIQELLLNFGRLSVPKPQNTDYRIEIKEPRNPRNLHIYISAKCFSLITVTEF